MSVHRGMHYSKGEAVRLLLLLLSSAEQFVFRGSDTSPEEGKAHRHICIDSSYPDLSSLAPTN